MYESGQKTEMKRNVEQLRRQADRTDGFEAEAEEEAGEVAAKASNGDRPLMEAAREKAESGGEGMRRVGREAVYGGHLMLVNRDYPVRECHTAVLKNVAAAGLHLLDDTKLETACFHMPDGTMKLETVCLSALEALIAAARVQEDVVVVSGFRSMEEQTAIYEGSLAANGAAYTANYVALPGRSEHQTGLAVDLGERTSGELDFIAPSFPDEGACLIFKRLAAAYGFVQRYKQGKEELTGIACEPWHFRYVGTPHAGWMERLDMCLEEYIAYLRNFAYEGERLEYTGDGWKAESYYVAAAEFGDTNVPIPACDAHKLSGNNIDGFIVTAYYGAGHEL